jgi:L-malate glycosyltransferase
MENSVLTSNKNVLLVGNFLSATLGRAVGEDLAIQLSERGWSVILTSHKVGKIPRLADMVSSIWKKRKEYQVAQVDVFSGNAFVWAEAACWALRKCNKPYILTLRGGNLPVFSERWPDRVRNLLNSAAAVTTPSAYFLELMRPYRKDLILLPNPVQIKNYDFRERPEPQANLVWMRSFHSMYNPELSLKVLALLRKDFPQAKLSMIGPDRGDGSLQKTRETTKALNLTDCVVFPGKVNKSDIPMHLNQGDIFLNTTNLDNTPVSVMEAMASGMCIVSTNVGGLPYLLEDGVDSLLVDPDDAEKMLQAVLRILREPGLAGSLSRNTRSKAEQFDWSRILPQWEELFEKVLKGNLH